MEHVCVHSAVQGTWGSPIQLYFVNFYFFYYYFLVRLRRKTLPRGKRKKIGSKYGDATPSSESVSPSAYILDSHRRHIGGHCGPANGRVPFLPMTGSDDRQRCSMTSPASHASKPRSLSSNLTAPLNSALFFETYVSVASEGVRLIRDDSARMSCTLKSYFPRSDNNIGEDGRSTIPSRGCPKEAETPTSCVCGWAEVVAAAGVRWKLRACRTLLWRVFLSYMTVLSHWSCQARLQTCSERTYVEANVLRICVRRVRR